MGQLQYIYNSAAGPRIVIDNINGYTGMTRFEVKFSLQNNPSVNPLYLNFPFYEGSVTLGSSTINFNGLSAAYVQDQIYTIGCGNGTKYINETVSPFTSQQRSDTYHMWFNANAGGRVLMHIYYLKFFDANDNVILDFVPFDDNGTIGLKDINENLFYTNWSGASGSWIAGPPYVPPTPSNQVPINKYKLGTSNVQKTYNGSTQINKMYIGSDLVYRAVPTTITPTTPTNVDYVHTSTPTLTANYIDTGVYPTTDTVFRVVFKPNNPIDSCFVGFCPYNAVTATPIYCSNDSTDYRYFFYGSITNSVLDFNGSRITTTRTFDSNGYADITVGNNYITDNIAQSTRTGTTQSTITPNIPIYLNVSSDLDFRSLEIWQNNVKVYDGHAAVLNGEYGVYDSVGGTFTTQTYGGNTMSGGNI